MKRTGKGMLKVVSISIHRIRRYRIYRIASCRFRLGGCDNAYTPAGKYIADCKYCDVCWQRGLSW
jgi:hypothetical protein